MNQIIWKRLLTPTALVAIAVCWLMASASHSAGGSVPPTSETKARDDDDRERYLFVWAGDQARARPDFLSVIDFNEGSHN